jgi:hypothetical protein
MATRIKSSQITDGAIVAADLHSAIAINTTQSGTFGSLDSNGLLTVAGANILINDGSNNNERSVRLQNTTVTAYLGIEGTSANRFSGSTANNMFLGTTTEDGIQFATNNTVRATIDSSGDTSLLGALDVTGLSTLAGNLTLDSLNPMIDFSGDDSIIYRIAVDEANNRLTLGHSTNRNIYLSNTGHTTLNYGAHVAGTTTSTNTTSGALTVAGGIGVAENAYIGGNVVVTGNLTVEGTSVTLNTTALDVEDKNITLNYHASNDTSASADGAGITIQDAVDASNDATILWNATNDAFDFSHPITVDGTAIINGGIGVASTGTVLIRQRGDTYDDGIALTSSHANSARIYKDANGKLHIYNTGGGVDDFVLDNVGSLGIGTANPSGRLHVSDVSDFYVDVDGTDSAIVFKEGDGNSWRIGNRANGDKFNITQDGTSLGTDIRFTIDDGGNVGIGTDDPTHKLDVNGAIATRQVRHSIRPSLLLDFANSKKLDSRITFTRSSTGTYWDGKTTVKAEENLWFPSTSYGQEAFLDDSTVTVTNNNATAPDGTSTAAKVQDNSASASHYIVKADSSVETGVTHTISFYVKYGSGYGWVGIGLASARLAWFDVQNGTQGSEHSSVQSTSITSVGNGWYRCAVAINPPNTTDYWQIRLASADNGVTYTANGSFVYVWGAQLEKRSAVTAYTPTTNRAIVKYQKVLQTAAAGQARFDHDPVTGESKGLLIERSATSYAQYSTPSTAWGQGAQMITPNYAIAPDGTQTAAFIHESATSRQQLAYTNLGNVLASGSTYTFSVYAKAYTHASFEYHSWGDSSKGFNLASPSNSSNSTMTHVGNGWYRCTWTKTKTNTSAQMYLGFDGNTYAGDANKGLLFWGAQVELGTFATSHIPTAGSAVTRSPDQPTVTGSDFDSIYNVSEGTVFARFMFGYDSDVDQRYIVSGGNGYARWLYTNAGDNNSIVDYDGSSGSIVNTTADNVWSSAAQRSSLITLKKNVAANGQVDSGGERTTTGTINTLSTEFRIGHGTGNAGQINGWMSKFAYYPKALTDAELIALTEE